MSSLHTPTARLQQPPACRPRHGVFSELRWSQCFVDRRVEAEQEESVGRSGLLVLAALAPFPQA